MAKQKGAAASAVDDSVEDPAVLVLMPGESLKCEVRGKPCSIEVFPLGIKHMRSFPAAVTSLVTLIQSKKIDMGPPARELNPEPMDENETIGAAKKRAAAAQKRAEQATQDMAGLFVPLLLKDGIDLLASCCVLEGFDNFDDAPHWVLPTIARSFIDQSFGHGRIRPWIAAADAAIEGVTGRKDQVSAVWSKLSSSAGIVLKTSSNGDKSAGRTQDGVSRSSSSSRTKPRAT